MEEISDKLKPINEYEMELLGWIPIEKLNWAELSFNPNAMHLLEKYPEKIHWVGLSLNPSIFQDAYHKASKQYFHRYVFEELVSVVFHPKNISKFPSWGFDENED